VSTAIDQRNRLTRTGDAAGWLCWLCGEPVERGLPSSDPRRASIDHLIPRKFGGTNEMANRRLAHAACNSARGTDLTVLSDADWRTVRDLNVCTEGWAA
jgi:5-methylcytosine-specific restriction endonuclease McrA